MNPQLILKDLQYTVDDHALLKDISFEQDSIGITAILGPNGAGKSLLLSLIHGLIAPSAGTLSWSGQPAKTSKQDRSYVFQTPVVMRRSVLDNLIYPLKISKTPKPEIQRRATEMLRTARLDNLATHPAASLSGGEAQRMALARALITQPKTLLLDEPCSNLDPASTKMIESMIADFTRQGGSVFMTTHDLAQAKRLADTVLFLDNGCLLEHRPAISFFAQPKTPRAQAYLAGEL
ncbi:MAG: ABC transporter ATP-binding protein [Rhodobacteraceae bacterium]|nr:MAG: ABC transporter ATP-binding protein [Paracoccaceae bacterium]